MGWRPLRVHNLLKHQKAKAGIFWMQKSHLRAYWEESPHFQIIITYKLPFFPSQLLPVEDSVETYRVWVMDSGHSQAVGAFKFSHVLY